MRGGCSSSSGRGGSRSFRSSRARRSARAGSAWGARGSVRGQLQGGEPQHRAGPVHVAVLAVRPGGDAVAEPPAQVRRSVQSPGGHQVRFLLVLPPPVAGEHPPAGRWPATAGGFPLPAIEPEFLPEPGSHRELPVPRSRSSMRPPGEGGATGTWRRRLDHRGTWGERPAGPIPGGVEPGLGQPGRERRNLAGGGKDRPRRAVDRPVDRPPQRRPAAPGGIAGGIKSRGRRMGNARAPSHWRNWNGFTGCSVMWRARSGKSKGRVVELSF